VKVRQAGKCYMIGLRPDEIEWVRLLVKLLRHADPLRPELARQALAYVQTVSHTTAPESDMGQSAER
jgi:hypothetical protein